MTALDDTAQRLLPAASEETPVRRWGEGALASTTRELVNEVPVAFVFNGTTAAVMMASPLDIEDFAIGFALTEGYIGGLSDIEALEVIAHDTGIEARFWLEEARAEKIADRRRAMMGPIGCGLCGIDSLEQAMRQVPRVSSDLTLSPDAILQGLVALRDHQELHDKTRSCHAAGFLLNGDIALAREDVGRHNALDKLIGAITLGHQAATQGALLLTSRLSVELVQKAAIAGCPILAGVSGASSLAVKTARDANVTLIGFCRRDRFDVFTGDERLLT